MTLSKPASEIVAGDILIFEALNGRTRARVQKVEPGSEEDRVEPGKLQDPKPMVRLQLHLEHAIPVPDVPGWRTRYWTAWHYPEELVELCHRDQRMR